VTYESFREHIAAEIEPWVEQFLTPTLAAKIARRIREIPVPDDANVLRLLERAQTILGNMAAEEHAGFPFFGATRWKISDEPLRADAKNLLPLIDAALASYRGK
jgi:hypothetical protein